MKMHAAHRPGGHRRSAPALRPAAALATAGCAFPDPTKGPGGEGLSISESPGSPALIVQGITFSGPAFHKAEKACSGYLTAKGPPAFSNSPAFNHAVSACGGPVRR